MTILRAILNKLHYLVSQLNFGSITYLDHDESVLPECRALHGEGLGRTGIGGGEVVLIISHCFVEILGSGRLTEKQNPTRTLIPRMRTLD